jgi:hypothetical protein
MGDWRRQGRNQQTQRNYGKGKEAEDSTHSSIAVRMISTLPIDGDRSLGTEGKNSNGGCSNEL